MATRAEKQREAAKQLKTKFKLEKKLARKMRRFFRNQNRQVLELQDLGLRYDATNGQTELYDILYQHYDEASRKFKPGIVKKVNQALTDAGEEPIPLNHPQINDAISFFILNNVIASTRAITNTSNKEIVKAIDTTDNSKEAYKKLQSRNAPRSQLIAVTETQKASEGTKQTTLDSAQDVAIITTAQRITFQNIKEWITMGDTKVRPDHETANFQVVKAVEPFVVGGELLMYPGDLSLGASIWNVANCRCHAIYTVRII